MSRSQESIRNSRYHSDNLKDCERYREHIKTMERAIDIINGEEPEAIKRLMLQEIGCDALTYGDLSEHNGRVILHRLDERVKHIWGLVSEIKSFRHAIRMIEGGTGKFEVHGGKHKPIGRRPK